MGYGYDNEDFFGYSQRPWNMEMQMRRGVRTPNMYPQQYQQYQHMYQHAHQHQHPYPPYPYMYQRNNGKYTYKQNVNGLMTEHATKALDQIQSDTEQEKI